jgi:RHH-type transcriptional regulator, rel operon repressor / antitoxin RelB
MHCKARQISIGFDMASSNLSLRLPAELRAKLDEAARTSRRSRSQIVQMALEHHLDRNADESRPSAAEAVRRIRAFAGAVVPASGRRTPEEIDAHIRWLRGDD